MILSLVILLLTVQAPPPCTEVEQCRKLALEAQQREDFEAFHDRAWAAYRLGKSNDPEAMLLLARAQSLSGRPGDALVMLERVAAAGVPTGAATDPDFARVRALPRWSEVASRFDPNEKAPLPTAPPPDRPSTTPPAGTPPTVETEKAAAKKPVAEKAAAEEPVARKPAAEKLPAGKSVDEKVAPAAASGTAAVPTATEVGAAPLPNALTFETALRPSALVYDAVSRRFIVADRQARRIAVVDATTGGVATLVGAQGDLGAIGGMTIDPRQGDLWVVSSGGGGPQLHRIQLISGRVLASVPLTGVPGQVVALAFVPDAGLVVADDGGRLLRVAPTGRAELLSTLDYVPRALAADARGRLYVTGGAPRIARFTVGTGVRRRDTVEIEPGIPPDAPFAVSEGQLHFVVPVDAAYEIRTSPVRLVPER